MDWLRDAPPRENVRQRLRSELLTDEDFDAFCIDYFPGVAQRLSHGLNRVQKENLLLQMISPALINQRLKKLTVDEQNPWRKKTIIAVGFALLIGSAAVFYRYMYVHHDQPDAPPPRAGHSVQLEGTDLPAAVKPGPEVATTPLPETNTGTPEPRPQPPATRSNIAPAATKSSRPVNHQPALPANRPGPVQINRVEGNRGHVTIIQNNH